MYVDPTGELALTTALLLIGSFIFAGGTIGGIVSYNAAKEEGTSGVDLLNETADGILQGAVVGGIGAFLTVSTAGLLGVPSLAGTLGASALMVSATTAAVTTEVVGLQIKKGIAENDNAWEIADNCITSILYNNHHVWMTPLGEEVLSLGAGKIMPGPIRAMMDQSGIERIYAYSQMGNAFYNVYESIFTKDPFARAKERRYQLQ